MPVGRRIYGFADDETFFRFRDRAKREGLSVGEAFTAIVKAYAQGLELVRVRPKREHAPSENGFQTIKEGARDGKS